jgi:hypothetical protein
VPSDDLTVLERVGYDGDLGEYRYGRWEVVASTGEEVAIFEGEATVGHIVNMAAEVVAVAA